MEYQLHGGDIYHGKIALDFSVNVNPLGLPCGVQKTLRDSVEHWNCYPDPECGELKKRLAEHHGIEQERIVCGNGAADLIYRLVLLKRPKQALLLSPTFSEYERALAIDGCQIRYYVLRADQDYRVNVWELAEHLAEGDWLFLCNPNNPTGLAVPGEQLEFLAEICQKKQGFLVVDECFCEFLDQPEKYTLMEQIRNYPEVILLRAFTKSYAMAGLRLGYAICGDTMLAKQLCLTGQPWSVSVPAQEAGVAALRENNYLEQTRALVEKERKWMEQRLGKLGFWVFPSQVNYLLFRDEKNRYGNLKIRLREKGILIRDCSNFQGLEPVGNISGFRYYRTAVRTREENEQLIEAIRMCDRNYEMTE
ncbi:MAG: threonine-phosphate decarboxylase [Lachnospiraceae bacterium]|nr:threonine-phosphate decarboxylase [Lachnospiraceae bacterium]MCI9282010.1 threonine-phosphate decarboxylase [Lachnospiraceae bacterium]